VGEYVLLQCQRSHASGTTTSRCSVTSCRCDESTSRSHSYAKQKVLCKVSVMTSSTKNIDKRSAVVAFRLTCKQEFHCSKAQRL
jgi:hypothetical protein